MANGNSVAKLTGKETVGTPQDRELAKSLGLTPEETDYVIKQYQQNGAGGKWADGSDWDLKETMKAWVSANPTAAKRSQEMSLNETGFGVRSAADPSKPASNGQRAEMLYGKNIADTQAAVNQIPTSLSDYSYTAEQDQGPGYQLGDKVSTLGKFDPLQYDLQTQAINQTRTDTTGLDAQNKLLGTYQDLYNQGGLDDIDRARMAESQQVRAAQARGAEGAIMADAAEKGRAGGNAQLLSRLQAQQGAANGRAMDDLQTSALGLSRRNDLLAGQGAVAGQIQNSQDAIDQFNTMGERDRERDNIARKNAAKEANFKETGDRERTNVGIKNDAATAQFGADTDRSDKNTSRVNSEKAFNVSPGQGARGISSAKLAGQGMVNDARGSVADYLAGKKDKESKSASKKDWEAVQEGLKIGTGFFF